MKCGMTAAPAACGRSTAEEQKRRDSSGLHSGPVTTATHAKYHLQPTGQMIMNMRPALIDSRVINFYKLHPGSRRYSRPDVTSESAAPSGMTRRKLKFPESYEKARN